MNTYRSEYPNHVHLMHVVPSKHLFLLADGRLKYQEKQIVNKLEKVGESAKEVLVHMVIADHTSGAMYGESYSCREGVDPIGFLRRAWSKKEHTFFGGMPEVLCLSRAVEELWPQIVPFAKENGSAVVNPTSGFQSGAIYPKLWETEIRNWGLYGNRPEHKSLAALSRYCQTSCNNNFPKRLEAWLMDVPGRPPIRYL